MREAQPILNQLNLVVCDMDASLTFFVACWPILDPLARYRMVQEKGNERLVAAHNDYFPDETAMEIGNPYLVLDRNVALRS